MNWDNFFLAQAGAAAALTGLLFVAVSINLNRIITDSYLPDRALQSIILLLNVLLVSSLMLIPGQSTVAIGIEVLVLGIILWITTFRLALSILRSTPAEHKRHSRSSLYWVQVAALPFVAGALYILFIDKNGIYVIVPGILFSFSKAVTDSWILLVEINRE